MIKSRKYVNMWHLSNTVYFLCSIGSQIIDFIVLVVDITKGIQTQTAECLILAEITCKRMIVVLNKVDLIAESKREAVIEKVND